MGVLLSVAPECAQAAKILEAHFQYLTKQLEEHVDELHRLDEPIDLELNREKVEIREIKAGLKKAAPTLRPCIGPLWLRRRLIGACEEEKGGAWIRRSRWRRGWWVFGQGRIRTRRVLCCP